MLRAMQPEVLFVSKPIVAPFKDGSKCFVRDLSLSLTRHRARVMTSAGADVSWMAGAGDRISAQPVYGEAKSRYAPALLENLRAAAFTGLWSRSALWHFVFAPNARSSQVAALLKGLRGRPVLQTVASPPRSYEGVGRLLFGDVVVAQSEHTRSRLEAALAASGISRRRIEVISPVIGAIVQPSSDAIAALRADLRVGVQTPLLVYPGDLEVSRGAASVAAATPELLRQHPDLVVVFAYRDKTPLAAERARELAAQLPFQRVRLLRETQQIFALVATSQGILFPVDDLYGKVDIPILLLEAMALGTPVIALDQGPLAELEGVIHTSAEVAALVGAAGRLLTEPGARQACAEQQHQALARRHDRHQAARAYEALYDELLGGAQH